jgi:site-specific recombinase XerD
MKDLRGLKRQFLVALEVEQGRSAKTVENYNRYLERFFTYTRLVQPADLTEEHVKKFRRYLSQQPGAKVGTQMELMKPLTQNYYLIALRMFIKYINSCGYITISPELIELTSIPERPINPISTDELNRLRVAPDTKTIEGKRDRAIFELLFSTGLRISELCALSITDVDLAHDTFSIRGKDGIIRLVFLADTARDAIRTYIFARKDTDTALFVRYGRKQNDGGDLRVHPRAVQRLFKTYAAKTGLTQNVTPQIVRHWFAIDLLQHGADIRSVQVLLGHTSIDTTQIYTRD